MHNWACSFVRALRYAIRPKLFLCLIDIILFKHTWGCLARYHLSAPHTLARNITIPVFLVETNNWFRFVPTFKAVFVIRFASLLQSLERALLLGVKKLEGLRGLLFYLLLLLRDLLLGTWMLNLAVEGPWGYLGQIGWGVWGVVREETAWFLGVFHWGGALNLGRVKERIGLGLEKWVVVVSTASYRI